MTVSELFGWRRLLDGFFISVNKRRSTRAALTYMFIVDVPPVYSTRTLVFICSCCAAFPCPCVGAGFADEAAVSEFANSVNVGEPLNIPPVSLSPEESATVVS